MGLIEFLRGQFAPGQGGGALPYGNTPDPTLGLIQSFEGFRETPYWDVNAMRAGYGSDTITLPDGTVQRVGEGTRVSREDANRDLQRRVETEFMPIAARAVGQDAFAALAPHQKAALTSIAYNYGELPSSVAAAVQSGDPNAVAAAIAALGTHNGGVNAGRRKSEAEFYLTGVMGSGGAPTVAASTKGGAPVNGLLGAPQEQDASGLIGLLTGQQKPWAGKLNDIGAVLLALSGSPAAQPLMEQLNKRKDAKREDARINQTAQWLASMGRDDLAQAVMAGGLSGSDAASIAMTPAATPEAPKPYSSIGEIQMDLANGIITPEQAQLATDSLSKGGVTVNTGEVGAGLPGLSKLGEGYSYLYNPDGTVKLDSNGQPMAAAIPGTKAWADEQAAKAEAQTAEEKASLAADKTGLASDVVLGKLDELDALVAGSSTFSPATGFGAETAAEIGGTRAADTKAVIDTINANLSFDNLAAMRAASPTGGALGAISDTEIKLLSSTLASLSQKQSPEQFAAHVKELKDIYSQIKAKADAYPNGGEFGFGGTAPAAGGNTTATGVTWSVAP